MPNALGDYLRARRALATPPDAVPSEGRRRRVRGLRREEVAVLAGISSDYYTRLEQGRDRTPSPVVLAALTRALRLDAAGAEHLRALASLGRPDAATSAVVSDVAHPGVLRLLRRWGDVPALVLNARRDVLACTALAAACHPGLDDEPNLVRLLFSGEAPRAFYRDWRTVAAESVAALRAGTALAADATTERLVAELRADATFAALWERHDVRPKGSGNREVLHPVAGALSIEFETLRVVDSVDQTLTAYHVEPGTPSAAALARLAASLADPGAVLVGGPHGLVHAPTL